MNEYIHKRVGNRTKKGKDIPEQRLPRSGNQEDGVDVVEVSEIGIDLHHPVRPGKNDSDDVDERDAAGQERAVLHPRNHVVHGPGDVEADDCD